MNDLDKILAALKQVDIRLVEMDRELASLRGQPCEKCSRRDGDKIVGRPGEEVKLVGGYEAILCRMCRNAWAVAADESGHWIEYRKLSERLDVAREQVSRGISRGGGAGWADVELIVEEVVAAERKLFQFAMKWVAGGTP